MTSFSGEDQTQRHPELEVNLHRHYASFLNCNLLYKLMVKTFSQNSLKCFASEISLYDALVDMHN